MGRYYIISGAESGEEVKGKFWFAVQSSYDVENMCVVEPKQEWMWCYCEKKEYDGNYCHRCFNSHHDHVSRLDIDMEEEEEEEIDLTNQYNIYYLTKDHINQISTYIDTLKKMHTTLSQIMEARYELGSAILEYVTKYELEECKMVAEF